MPHIAAYGTLRVGNYNFNRFNLIPIKENVLLEGYELYDLGPYPCIIKKEGSTIVIDILECSETTLDSIRRMEIGAGYKCETIVVNDLECEIYYFTNKPTNAKVIKHGDYNKNT